MEAKEYLRKFYGLPKTPKYFGDAQLARNYENTVEKIRRKMGEKAHKTLRTKKAHKFKIKFNIPKKTKKKLTRRVSFLSFLGC